MNLLKLNFGDDVVSVVFNSFDKNQFLNFPSLSSSERQVCSGFLSDKRKREYIFSRMACKEAIKSINPELFNEYQEISVLNSESGCPHIVGADLVPSISHTDGWIAVIVGTKAFGIDIEKYDVRRIKALKRVSPESENSEQLIILWTLKESLSKALKTGMIEDFSHYETEKFLNHDEYFSSDFKRFPDYKGLAVFNGYMAAAIAFKKEYGISIKQIETLTKFMKDSISNPY